MRLLKNMRLIGGALINQTLRYNGKVAVVRVHSFWPVTIGKRRVQGYTLSCQLSRKERVQEYTLKQGEKSAGAM